MKRTPVNHPPSERLSGRSEEESGPVPSSILHKNEHLNPSTNRSFPRRHGVCGGPRTLGTEESREEGETVLETEKRSTSLSFKQYHVPNEHTRTYMTVTRTEFLKDTRVLGPGKTDLRTSLPLSTPPVVNVTSCCGRGTTHEP